MICHILLQVVEFLPDASYKVCTFIPSSNPLAPAMLLFSQLCRCLPCRCWQAHEPRAHNRFTQALRLNLRSARLDPRDISLFAERRGFSNQRATLMPRDGLILFRTEITRSIIMADRAWIFQSRLVRSLLPILIRMPYAQLN